MKDLFQFNKLAIATGLALGFTALANASETSVPEGTDQIGTETNKSFAQKIGRPISLATLNPPHGFLEKLSDLDRESGILDLSNEDWRPFQESDVWVFFVGSPKDLPLVGFFAKDIISKTAIDDDAVGHGVGITLHTDPPREVFVQYYFMDRYDLELSEVSCRFAVSLHSDFAGISNDEIRNLISDCS